MGSCSRTREFPGFYVRVQHSVLQHDKLTIPKKIWEHIDGEEPRKSRLETRAGKWHVDVKQQNQKFSFKQGWMRFVKGNGLRPGQTLVFHYNGNWNFYVEVYGSNGCIKSFSKAPNKNDTPPVEDGVIDTDSDSNTSIDAVGSETQNSGLRSEEESSSTAVVTQSRRESVPEPANIVGPRNPSFRITISQTHVGKGPTLTPRKFMRNMRKPTLVKLRVGNRSWNVTWRHADQCSSRFTSGWPRFARENELEVGNVCVFEMMSNEDNVAVMEVRIYRCLV